MLIKNLTLESIPNKKCQSIIVLNSAKVMWAEPYYLMAYHPVENPPLYP